MKIAIVGGGPKGMYGFERLAAQFAAHPPPTPVEIHVFNRTVHFGSGDIYRPDQPDYLLINYALGNIDAWIDAPPHAVAPQTPSLFEWLHAKKGLSIDVCDYASRGLVGEYLEACFRAIADNLPARVTGRYFVGEVVDLWQEAGGHRLTLRDEGVQSSLFQHVLLTTGHPRNRPISQPNTIPFIYPVNPTLTTIPAGKTVVIKGMGLTFVDAVLALTEGKGGTFRREFGQLSYQPSGDEPTAIYAYSRSGLPMLPRPPHVGASAIKLRYLTEEALGNRPIDFSADLRPLLEQEMIYAYYRVLLRPYGIDLEAAKSFNEVTEIIEHFHQLNWTLERFNPTTFLDPLHQTAPLKPLAQHHFILDYLRKGVAAALRGLENDPLAAVTAVWRRATPVFQRAFRFGGLTPRSHRYFMENYASALNRVAFGPPIESMEKMIALAESGILRFDFSRGGSDEISADLYIDARIPKISYKHNDSPLYQNLLKRGLAQPFTNADSTDSYQPGCLAIDECGRLISTDGNATNITLYGTPTEGIVYDNDSLSRHCNNFASAWAASINQLCFQN